MSGKDMLEACSGSPYKSLASGNLMSNEMAEGPFRHISVYPPKLSLQIDGSSYCMLESSSARQKPMEM